MEAIEEVSGPAGGCSPSLSAPVKNGLPEGRRVVAGWPRHGASSFRRHHAIRILGLAAALLAALATARK